MVHTFKIKRFYFEEGRPSRTIVRGLTLEQAQLHCRDPSTKKIKKDGTPVYFEGYTAEDE